jgi:hypoxanthine phosphoribosyltransferase
MSEHRVRVLYDEAAITARNRELACEIRAHNPVSLLVVAILKGSFMFAADLMRDLHREGLSPQVEFMHLSSYRAATVSSGQVAILRDVESEVRGRDVLLIDDILESGRTLAFAKELLAARGASRVLTCCLLEKPGKRAVSITDIDPVGSYAVKLVFSDGHDTGIFSWALLYDYGLNKDTMWARYLQRLEAANSSRDPAR